MSALPDRPRRRLSVRSDNVQAVLMLLPMLCGFALFTYGPILYILRFCLYKANDFKATYIGFDNFARLFSRDGAFWDAMLNTVILSGGKLIVHAPKEAGYDPGENIIIGNVALYGATSGEAYIAGMAGERFCIRNSGVTAVVEGVGEHGCEYMTGGRAVILGPTGKNFAAGMSGGIAYVLDEKNTLYKNLNKELVLMEHVEQRNEKEELKRIIERHVESTGSKKGQRILEDFDHYIGSFKKIIPADYKEMIHLTAQNEEKGMTREQAQIEAFTQLVG